MKSWRQVPKQFSWSDAKQAIEEVASTSPSINPIYCDFDKGIDPLTWLSNQQDSTKLFWSNRGSQRSVAGIGLSDAINGKDILDRVRKRSFQGNRRYYGGFFFDDSIGQMWAPLWWTDGQKMVYNPPLPNPDKIQDSLPFDAKSIPEQQEWLKIMGQAMTSLGDGKIKKIVLARQKFLRVDRSAYGVLKELMKDKTPAYAFAFQPGGNQVFIGRSPECLFHLKESRLTTEAIAGTRQATDVNGCADLISADKDRREHQLVVDGIVSALKSIGLDASADNSPHIIQSGSLIHLKTNINCEANDEIAVQEALKALHPTAAVCGTPTQAAFDLISKLEHFDRGWFAGPIGWSENAETEFAVAIRSATFQGQKALIYAGAGIVAGSNPTAEWNEIAAKGAQYNQFEAKS